MGCHDFDVVVVGGGPGGYVAAIRASQLGFNTALIERESLGGICLNWGCIPTKSLLHAANIQRLLDRIDEFGFSVKELHFDLPKIVDRSRKIASGLSDGISHLMKKHKVTVIKGEARLDGPAALIVRGENQDSKRIVSNNVILATGAHAMELPGTNIDNKYVWTYREAMVPEVLPESLIVIGSGAIGVEFASFYNAFGTDVTMVEKLDYILPSEDKEISRIARKTFEKQGVSIHTGCSVSDITCEDDFVTMKLESPDERSSEIISASRAIVAIGISGNTQGIGLEENGVQIDRGHVVVDQWLYTGVGNLYAIGDLVGPPWLAHKAMHEAVICVEHMAGVDGVMPMNQHNIPSCIYSSPQVASIGLTEEAALQNGYKVNVGRFPLTANGKALAQGDGDGLVKTIFDATTGELLGAHMIGAEVTELIYGYGLAKELETTELDLIRTIFPHPTISEAMHEAVLNAYSRAIHM